MRLQLRNKTPKRRVKAKLRDHRQLATRPNEVWAMDFLHEQLATGRKIRVLTVVATFSRFSPALDTRLSHGGEDVVQTLEMVCSKIGYPATVRVGAASSSPAISTSGPMRAASRSTSPDPASRPTTPSPRHSTAASGAECMNAHRLLTLADAREKLEAWRRYYNEDRPHGAIGHKPPISLQKFGDAASPSP
jgi:putative transposase